MRLRAPLFLALAAMAALAAGPAANPRVVFTTSLGKFTAELDPGAAPATVANFIAYVKSGHYAGTTFHRIIPTFMIQGGGLTPDLKEKATTRPPVRNEAREALAKGQKNVRGSLAMARTSAPHSATAQFFVNVVDNPMLDYPSQDGWGYCVFGKVVAGMDTVDRFRMVKTGPGDVPATPVIIEKAELEPAVRPKAKP